MCRSKICRKLKMFLLYSLVGNIMVHCIDFKLHGKMAVYMCITLIISILIYVDGMEQIKCSKTINAVCQLSDPTGMNNIKGIITLNQRCDSPFVTVEGKITGLKFGPHGFHVHRDGNVGKNCSDAGPHFNPFNEPHGAPFDRKRHVGDLGNIYSDLFDTAYVVKVDHYIQLKDTKEPNLSIIGRSIVVHADRDDLGRGHNKESLITGNAGARLACCEIKLKQM